LSWKSENGLVGDAEVMGPFNSVREMDERMEHTRVRLVQGWEGLRLHTDYIKMDDRDGIGGGSAIFCACA
jgi:hypothetical protein